jgi:hypothetical protein
MNSSDFWNITLCSPLKLTDVSEEHVASVLSFVYHPLHAGVLLGLFFYPEDGSDKFHGNFG